MYLSLTSFHRDVNPLPPFMPFDKKRLEVFHFIEKELEKGRQAYVVYPLISESEKFDYRDLEAGFEQLNNYFLPKGYPVGMVHGKLKPAEKDQEMRRFVTAGNQDPRFHHSHRGWSERTQRFYHGQSKAPNGFGLPSSIS